jgi:hypothetical protein
LAWRVERTVTNSLTVQYDRVAFILVADGFGIQMAFRFAQGSPPTLQLWSKRG